MGVGGGSRLHTGSWAKKEEWGAVMKSNVDGDCEIVSYDMFMDTNTSTLVSTVSAANVEKDVAYAREISRSQNNPGSGVSGKENPSVTDSETESEKKWQQLATAWEQGGEGR